jgi:hypothetical protein
MSANSFRTLLCVLAVFLTGCGTVKVEIRQPPTPTSAAYQPIPIGAAANASSDFASPPTGDVTLGDVPYQLSEWIFKSQAALSPYDGYPTSVLLETNVPRAQRLHLLINTGNGFAQFNGQAIGRVIVTCGDAEIQVADLHLGQEVREWQLAHNVIYTASQAQEVWVGARADQPHLAGHIDLLSIDLPEICRSERLTTIEVVDTSVDTVGSLDPALNLFGVTVEYRH